MSTTPEPNEGLVIPEGWIVFGETVGPKIKKKDHLSGNQDKSKFRGTIGIGSSSSHPSSDSDSDGGDGGGGEMSEEEYKFFSEEYSEEEAEYADDKKYTHTYTDKKGKKRKVRYGAKGYRISPGTKKGDSYCARSYGDMKSHNKDCSGKDRNTPMCLSRRKWKCKGKKSSK